MGVGIVLLTDDDAFGNNSIFVLQVEGETVIDDWLTGEKQWKSEESSARNRGGGS